MALSNQQAAFIQRVQSSTHKLAVEIAELIELRSMYFDRGYNSAGDNAITDDDLLAQDIDAGDLGSTVTAIEQLGNWRDNADVLTGDYGATLNKMRAL